MNYTRDNPILQKVFVRDYDFSDSDYDSAKKIIHSQGVLFGMPTTENQRDQMLNWFHTKDDTWVPIIAYFDGEPSGIMALRFWKPIPCWTVGMNYNLRTEGLNFNKNRALSVTMLDYCLRVAQERNTFSGFIIVADTNRPNSSVRKRQEYDMVPMNTVKNWVWHDVERIPPFTESKYETFRQMCGMANGKNKHTLVVRQIVRIPEDNRV